MDRPKRIGVTRVHMEDDAGKSIHDGFKDSDRYTYVDLNRSGTPLIEIVSEPDLRSSDDAYAISDRAEAGDAVRGRVRVRHGEGPTALRRERFGALERRSEKFGTKAEVKNLNSFRFAKMAVDYEIARQVAVLEGGGQIEQETRLYNVATGETVGMRSKEHAHDYRYFPEPDLVPLRVSEAWLSGIRDAMVGASAERSAGSFESNIRLDASIEAQVLTATRAVSEYFEKAAAASGDPRGPRTGSPARFWDSTARSRK